MRAAWVASEPCPPRNGYSQNLAGMINDAPEMAGFALHACAYVAAPAAAPVDGSTEALFDLYGARVGAEIQRLRVNIDGDIFVVFDAGIGYVQCHPDNPPAVINCEAQSADSWPALAAILTPDRIARLHAAGYTDPGRVPNYWKNYPADHVDDQTIARELLTLLHDVYGYTGAQPRRWRPRRGRRRSLAGGRGWDHGLNL